MATRAVAAGLAALVLSGCAGVRPHLNDSSPAAPKAGGATPAVPKAGGATPAVPTPAVTAAPKADVATRTAAAGRPSSAPDAVLTAQVEDQVSEHAQAGALASAASHYVPVNPIRVLDSRSGLGHRGAVAAGEAFSLTVTGVAGVPTSGVVAVVMNVTATNAAGAGYVTTWPAGQARPDASSLNVDRAGQTIPNLVTVPTGANGAVSLYASVGIDLVADVEGYYAASGDTATGRLVARTPMRIADTRSSKSTHFGPLDPNEAVTVDTAPAGAPTDAIAAVLNVTVTGPTQPGYWTVTAAGTSRPTASNLNVERAGQTIANQVIAPLANGRFSVYSQAGGHLVVDIAGWYTGASAGVAPSGMFVPLTPTRVLDTRRASDSPTGGRPAVANQAVTGPLGALAVPADGVSAVAANVTITSASAPGFVTVAAAGVALPTASNVNVSSPGQTIANHAITPVSSAGFTVFTQSGGHLVADVTGYFTGQPVGPSANGGTPPPSSPPPTGQPTSPPATGAHAFLYSFGDGTYARWNPCAPIRYAVNFTYAPPGARAALADAVAKVVASTGLTFEDAGDTTAGLDGNPPDGLDAIIAFASAGESAGKLSSSGVLGVGGGSFTSYPSNRVVAGYVLVNRDFPFAPGYGDNSLGETLLHELGHMVGLAHVNDASEVMYPTSHSISGWGNGDREGLWYLGAAQTCLAS